MDVFQLRQQVVEEYGAFVRSFLTIRDPEIERLVERELAEGRLWPDPLIQLNPAFEPGETLSELIGRGALHGECARIFCAKDEQGQNAVPIRLHRQSPSPNSRPA